MTVDIDNLAEPMREWTDMTASASHIYYSETEFEKIMEAMGEAVAAEKFKRLPKAFDLPFQKISTRQKLNILEPYQNTAYEPFVTAMIDVANASRDVPDQDDDHSGRGHEPRMPALISLTNALLSLNELKAAYVVTHSIAWGTYTRHWHGNDDAVGDMKNGMDFIYDKIGPLFGFDKNKEAEFVENTGALMVIQRDERDVSEADIYNHLDAVAETGDSLALFKAYVQGLKTAGYECVEWTPFEDIHIKPKFMEHYKRSMS